MAPFAAAVPKPHANWCNLDGGTTMMLAAARESLASVDVRDRAMVKELRARLSRVGSGDLAGGCTPVWLASELGELLRIEQFIAYRPARDEQSAWRLRERVTNCEGLCDAYDAHLASSVTTAFNYEPLRPAREHRNRVHCLDEIHRHGPETTCVVEDTWPKFGIGGQDQIRALVCQGPVLLAFVGGLRAERFQGRERAAFSALVGPLRRALILRRALLDAGMVRAGLDCALEALGEPAFIARPAGLVVHANPLGETLLNGDPSAIRSAIRDAIAGRSAENHCVRLGGLADPELFLVVLRGRAHELEARLRTARDRWSVTGRESDVLRCVAVGDANKEIALKLQLHESSVERHLTALLRKASCDSRSRLIAVFWTRL